MTTESAADVAAAVDFAREHNLRLVVRGGGAGAIMLFASGRVRPDVVAILVVLTLNLTGVLTIQEALAGFGQPVVVLIAAVSVVGEGLIATGRPAYLAPALYVAKGFGRISWLRVSQSSYRKARQTFAGERDVAGPGPMV